MKLGNFYSYFIEENKHNIFIPSLQRDYVQGGKDYIIEPFLTKLIISLKNEQNELVLNYIYGYECGEGFVPVDGQQRLITLWLLYLYLYAKGQVISNTFPDLIFQSREYANDFARELKKSAEVVSHGVQKEEGNKKYDDLFESSDIKECKWFISSWNDDITVQNMVKTWIHISSAIPNGIESSCLKLKNITFYFEDISKDLNNEENDKVNDDIYIKMNGRGKPLSYYDNLKALIDKEIGKLKENNDNRELINNWQKKIDNELTDIFWANRNENQTNSEEIDDEQIRFFYTAMLIYWLKEKDLLKKHLETIFKDSKNNQDLIVDYYGLKKFDLQEITEKIIEQLREMKSPLPIVWVEVLNLLDEKVLCFIYEKLETLLDLGVEKIKQKQSMVENCPINLYLTYDSNIENTTKFYKIALNNTYYNSNIPYLYALMMTPKVCRDNEPNFSRWMRLIRNLVVNSDINRDNITDVLKSIQKLSKEIINKEFYNFDEDVEKVLNKEELKGFDTFQVLEENLKVLQIQQDESFEKNIFEAEETYFNKGAINFLFFKSVIDKNKNEYEYDWSEFNNKLTNFKEYFNEKGLNEKYTISIPKAFLKLWNVAKDEQVFGTSSKIWRHILTNTAYTDIINILLLKNSNDISLKDNNDYKRLKSLCMDDFFLEKIQELMPQETRFSLHHNLYPALFKADTRGNSFIYLYHEKRNRFFYEYSEKIEFNDKCNETILSYYKTHSNELENIEYPFLFGKDIYFNLKNGQKKLYFRWDHYDVMWCYENNVWSKMENLNDLKNEELSYDKIFEELNKCVQ